MYCDVCMGINSHLCPVCGGEPEMKTCPDCEGKGHIYLAYDIRKNDMYPVTATTYSILPDDEDIADALGQHVCKGEDYECDTCCGTGEVEVEEEDYCYED